MPQGALQQRDYVRAQFLHMRPRRAFAVVGVLLLLLLGVAVVIGDGALPMLAVLTWLGLQFFVYIPWRARKAFDQHKALSAPVNMTIREDGLFFDRERSSGLLLWSEILKWRTSDELILLYPADHIFHLIPRHFFASDEEFAGFNETLAARIGRPAS